MCLNRVGVCLRVLQLKAQTKCQCTLKQPTLLTIFERSLLWMSLLPRRAYFLVVLMWQHKVVNIIPRSGSGALGTGGFSRILVSSLGAFPDRRMMMSRSASRTPRTRAAPSRTIPQSKSSWLLRTAILRRYNRGRIPPGILELALE